MADQPGGSRSDSGPPGVPSVTDNFNEIVGYKKDSRWYSRAGHYFVASRTRGASTTMRCAADRCPAHWTLRAGHAGPLVGQHNHDPTPWVPYRNAMFQALKRRATAEHISFSTIYEEEAARYPDAASHLLYESVLPSMRKWRKSAQPAVPHTLREYAVALTDHREQSSMLLATVSVAEAFAVILVMPGWERCFNESDVLVVDGTFLTVPAGLPIAQILTVHCVVAGHFFHPIVVLMENRRRPLYEAVFNRIWQTAGNPRPTHIITDYEQALRSALMSVTGMQIQGCMFHFVQALVRRAQQMGMAGVQHRNSPMWRLVQLYSTLALLPAVQIPVGLAEVQHIAATERLPFSEPYHEYFVAQWLTRVGPEGFSVHGSAHRTSNVAESFHASLRRSLGPSPNVWRFTDVIGRKFSVSASRLEAQRRGELPRRNRDRALIRSGIQSSNARALESGRISIREFLAETSRSVDVGVEVVLNDVPDIAEEVVIGHGDDDDLQLIEPEVILDDLPAINLRPMSPSVRPASPPIRPASPPARESPPLRPVSPIRPPTPPVNRPVCLICITDPLEIVLIPCGHTMCRSCLDRWNEVGSYNCPQCRSDIRSTHRIYI